MESTKIVSNGKKFSASGWLAVAILLPIVSGWPARAAESPVPSFETIVRGLTEESLATADEQYGRARELSDRSRMPSDSDYAEAMKLYESAASKGHIFAMHNLALHLEHGIGVKQNLAAAFKWYLLASNLGFAGSQNNLGDMYEQGQGVPQSFGDAIYWYTRAVMQGDAVSFLSLGSVYLEGRGVIANIPESTYWLTLAVAHLPDGSNLKAAQTKLALAKRKLTRQELAEVELRARLYEPLKKTSVQLGDTPE
jgi:hypothetical protein